MRLSALAHPIHTFRAVRATITWACEYFRFLVHYYTVWEKPGRFWASDRELDEEREKMSNGVMRFEYQRIEVLKQKAVDAWSDGREGRR